MLKSLGCIWLLFQYLLWNILQGCIFFQTYIFAYNSIFYILGKCISSKDGPTWRIFKEASIAWTPAICHANWPAYQILPRKRLANRFCHTNGFTYNIKLTGLTYEEACWKCIKFAWAHKLTQLFCPNSVCFPCAWWC